MAQGLTEYFEELYQDIQYEAEAGGMFQEEAFVTLTTDLLMDAGELSTFDYQPLIGRRGIRIDGSGGDPLETDGVLTLVTAHFNPSPTIESLTQTEMNLGFNRVMSFVRQCLDEDFRFGLDESSPVFGLADMIAARWKIIDRIRVIMVTNRQLSRRIDGRRAEDILGKTVAFNVWDIGRLHQFETSGKGREEIEIDLEEEFGHGFPALAAHLPSDSSYQSYLAVVPGKDLAAIYDRWGARLLEQNVRVFLQARGNVNKGIRNTLLNDPEMFFAYNNGITATAEDIQFSQTGSGPHIVALKNLQIVNGGQTTASIHAASKNKDVNLDNVFVQMKLSIVEAKRSMEVVPKISEYANSQNRVSAADFFSNHPFHIRIEDISRRLAAPSKDGTFRTSKWFYERARGQYQDERGKLTAARRKAFELEFPRSQLFTKTDLAKFENIWREIPHIVSTGAQKNFANFAQHISAEWDKNPDQFNDRLFQRLVARAIIFKETERIVSRADWYEGGYRANIVAHGISRLAYEVHSRRREIDFDSIWHKQEISPALAEALESATKTAQYQILRPKGGVRNISEWAKKDECWKIIRTTSISTSSQFSAELKSLEDVRNEQEQGEKERGTDNLIDAQMQVLQSGPDFWKSVAQWGLKHRHLTEKDMDILKRAISAGSGGRIPTERQCGYLVRLVGRLVQEGCPHTFP
jgi:hypothetical protein